MFLKKILITVFAASFALNSTASLLTPVEKELFGHILIFTKKATAKSGVHVFPWVSCYDLDKDQEALFMSRPVFDRDHHDPTQSSGLLKWLVDLINTTKENSVKRMICAYEVDHFSKCQLQTVFELRLNDDHQMILFEHIYEQEVCKGNLQ